MDVDFHYGREMLRLKVPRDNVQDLVRPWHAQTQDMETDPIQAAITNDAALAFRRLIKGKRICLLLPDSSRLTPFIGREGEIFLILRDCAQVLVVICTGTHSPNTPSHRALIERLQEKAKDVGLAKVQVVAHDAYAEDGVEAGFTSRGTRVWFNPILKDADVFWALSDVKVHYFAGYSNPIKNIVPGVCAFSTVEQNHSWALHESAIYGRHPWHAKSERRDNPLAQDQLEAMQNIIAGRPFYALVTVGAEGRASWATFGLAKKVSPEAFAIADLHNTHTITPVRRMIVSPGGHPDDVDLYIAQRALELTQAVLENGGEVLFLAACPGGVGEPHTLDNFYNRLIQPFERVLRYERKDYVLFGHKPIKFARLIERLRRVWFYSEIADEQIRAMQMTPIGDPQAVVDNWLQDNPQVSIAMVDGANKIALYRQSTSEANES